jgi:hypothetical protein
MENLFLISNKSINNDKVNLSFSLINYISSGHFYLWKLTSTEVTKISLFIYKGEGKTQLLSCSYPFPACDFDSSYILANVGQLPW